MRFAKLVGALVVLLAYALVAGSQQSTNQPPTPKTDLTVFDSTGKKVAPVIDISFQNGPPGPTLAFEVEHETVVVVARTEGFVGTSFYLLFKTSDCTELPYLPFPDPHYALVPPTFVLPDGTVYAVDPVSASQPRTIHAVSVLAYIAA